ncbi:MAG: hypothetical protein ACFFFG_15860 [Candidatus Thorarchaeota archaeon]
MVTVEIQLKNIEFLSIHRAVGESGTWAETLSMLLPRLLVSSVRQRYSSLKRAMSFRGVPQDSLAL